MNPSHLRLADLDGWPSCECGYLMDDGQRDAPKVVYLERISRFVRT